MLKKPFPIPLGSVADLNGIRVWIGLYNPTLTNCEGLTCNGILEWADGSDFAFDGDIMDETRWPEANGGSNPNGACFVAGLQSGTGHLGIYDLNIGCQSSMGVICQYKNEGNTWKKSIDDPC